MECPECSNQVSRAELARNLKKTGKAYCDWCTDNLELWERADYRACPACQEYYTVVEIAKNYKKHGHALCNDCAGNLYG